MIDTEALKKRWGTEQKKEPVKKAVKKVVKKPVQKKTVKKSEKKQTVHKPQEKPKEKKETVPPSSLPVKPPRNKPPINTEYGEGYDGDSLGELTEQAAEAKLREQISKAELAAYKVEKESLALKKAAGDVQETAFAEFLYYGYMEKCNLDLLRMMKRIEPMIENMVNDHNTAGIIKRINNEITTILKSIQKQQDEDRKNWKKEL